MTTTPATPRARWSAPRVLRIVPDADLDALAPTPTCGRARAGLAGLPRASSSCSPSRAGVRIDEDDYPELATMASTQAFLARRSG